ncbi:flagellar biosynthesis regulator FlaF [Teichococcus oryzae]|uniref:Uncharacterized protein n=1 Tax=Teichococcus oryzae TaxID=1608942 RepID=A0A5B2TF39_9PROT|nr:flagellar biosynthesis regulator FlaF [Pseudoroseomonas oryzae]KAA2213116.1 hypothetical protein F0Q34_10785 [Pseudoroseomonas oryzae]
MTAAPARAAPAIRAAEAAAFRHALALLENARAGSGRMRAEAILATGLLWDAVLLASAGPASGLPAPLRRELTRLARSVLREIDRPVPDLDFLITVNGQMLRGLATLH